MTWCVLGAVYSPEEGRHCPYQHGILSVLGMGEVEKDGYKTTKYSNSYLSSAKLLHRKYIECYENI